MIEKEQQRLEKMKSIIQHGSDAVDVAVDQAHNETNDNQEDGEDAVERTRVKLDEDSEPEEEEDEEMALAREIEFGEGAAIDGLYSSNAHVDDVNVDIDAEDQLEGPLSGDDNDDEESLVNDQTQDPERSHEAKEGEENLGGDSIPSDGHSDETLVDDNTQMPLIDAIESKSDETGGVEKKDEADESNQKSDDDATNDESGDEQEFDDSIDAIDEKSQDAEKQPRNAAWKAMLKKEAENLKKQKANRGKNNLVEMEAEEEEEEEGVAGLEDFGFTVQPKKKDDDEEENDDADDEDFENIVDDVSDNEGDEEAGDSARKALTLKEEKLKHKEIMRRMREGYDGKRGGIAGGAGARGNLRFDQLVSADNKDDAKRLGLLNDDELDSDDEGNHAKKDDNEIEDETALLDKMLKDRYMNRTDIPEEEFTDSENEEEDDAVEDGKQTGNCCESL